LSSKARDPRAPLREEREVLPVELKAGRIPYACRTNIRVKTASDSQADSYSTELAKLLDTKGQMSAIAHDAAIRRGLQYMTVPEVEVMLGGGKREMS
jgi:hypothetical protein